jgi:signal transduction histidine kinase
MPRRWPSLRTLWPRSLLGRTLLVLLLGVIASNLIGVGVYSGDRLDVLTQNRARHIAEQVAATAAALQAVDPSERARLVRAKRQPGLRLFWSQRPFAHDDATGRQARMLREAFRAELGEAPAPLLNLSLAVPRTSAAGDADGSDDESTRRRGPPWATLPHAASPGGPELRLLTGSLRLDDGTWLNFAAPIPAFPPFWMTPYFLVLLASTVLVLAVSVWAVRRALQPLAMFAEAAERLGRDVDAPPLADDGPLEVRRAALAFNGMQQRLRSFVRDRTRMLAAISHDLRTPLTRLRLRAELIEDEEEQRKIIADLDEMCMMIDAALAFARDEAAVEQAAPLDLAILLQTVCDGAADAGGAVAYCGPAHAACVGRPSALRRAFTNLVDNARIYGGCARVGLTVAAGELLVTIDDDGPGIPDAELEAVFEPFRRLEGSRSRETGGAGLGLALVRAAIAAHGGRITLANRAGGGLRAQVVLPAAADADAPARTESLAKSPPAR